MVLEGKNYLTAPIEWSRGEDPEYPYEAEHKGHKLLVRLNDFPDEQLYALIADGEEITNFDDWPDSWTRPDRILIESLDDEDSDIQKQLPVSVPTVQQDLEIKEILEKMKPGRLSLREQCLLELLIKGKSFEDISHILQEDIRIIRSDFNTLKAKSKYRYSKPVVED